MADWSLLGVEPAPGSPGGIRQHADAWRRVARTFVGAAERLTAERAGLSAVWRESLGANAFGGAMARQQDLMHRAGTIMNAAAGAVDGYATELTGYQARAHTLLEAAEALVGRMDNCNRQLSELSPLDPVDQVRLGIGQQAEQLAAQIATARSDLEHLRTEAAKLHGEVITSADGCGSKLRTYRSDLQSIPEARVLTPGDVSTNGRLAGSKAYHRMLKLMAKSARGALPRSRAEVQKYWQSLDPRYRAELMKAYPSVIGNTDGIPPADRDTANRIALRIDVDSATQRLAALGIALPAAGQDPAAHRKEIAAALGRAGYQPQQIEAITGALAVSYSLEHPPAEPGEPSPPVQVLNYEPAAFGGRGRAAIAIGDISTADYVSVVSTGMGSSVPKSITGQVERSGTAYFQNARDHPGKTSAVIAYVGTQGPEAGPEVASQAMADAGAEILARDLDAYSAMRQDPEHSRFTMVAFSYGSTIAATAVSKYGVKLDGLLLVGSPGAGRAKSARDFPGVPAGQVYIMANSADPVTTVVQQEQDPAQARQVGAWVATELTARHLDDPLVTAAAAGVGADVSDLVVKTARPDLGVDPAGVSFGAVRLDAENGSTDRLDGNNHTGVYWQPGSQQMTNISAVITGDFSKATYGRLRPNPGDHFGGYDPDAPR